MGVAKRMASAGVSTPARRNMPIPDTAQRRASWNIDPEASDDCPKEFHYAAAVVCLLPGASRRIRLNFLFASLLISYLQFAVALLLLFSYGNLQMPCTDSDHCGGGKFCAPSGLKYDGRTFSSSFCLECDAAPSRCFPNGSAIEASRPWSTAELITVSSGSQLTAEDVVEMCTSCRTMLGGTAFFLVPCLPGSNAWLRAIIRSISLTDSHPARPCLCQLSEPPDYDSVYIPARANASWTDTWITLPYMNVVTMTWCAWRQTSTLSLSPWRRINFLWHLLLHGQRPEFLDP